MAGAADPQRVEDALQKAFAYLAKRDRSSAQVRARLEDHGVDAGTADETILELERQGYLDDERFARLFAEDRRNLDGWGTERIATALSNSGIDSATIEEAVGSRERGDEIADALRVLERKCPEPPTDDRERERALAHLVRRGYELELAYDAVRAYEKAA